MSQPDDGGPAFPTESEAQTGPSTYRTTGLSIRDYFAGQAMAAIIAKLPLRSVGDNTTFGLPDDAGYLPQTQHLISVGAYGYADAMLAERAKTG